MKLVKLYDGYNWATYRTGKACHIVFKNGSHKHSMCGVLEYSSSYSYPDRRFQILSEEMEVDKICCKRCIAYYNKLSFVEPLPETFKVGSCLKVKTSTIFSKNIVKAPIIPNLFWVAGANYKNLSSARYKLHISRNKDIFNSTLCGQYLYSAKNITNNDLIDTSKICDVCYKRAVNDIGNDAWSDGLRIKTKEFIVPDDNLDLEFNFDELKSLSHPPIVLVDFRWKKIDDVFHFLQLFHNGELSLCGVKKEDNPFVPNSEVVLDRVCPICAEMIKLKYGIDLGIEFNYSSIVRDLDLEFIR